MNNFDPDDEEIQLHYEPLQTEEEKEQDQHQYPGIAGNGYNAVVKFESREEFDKGKDALLGGHDTDVEKVEEDLKIKLTRYSMYFEQFISSDTLNEFIDQYKKTGFDLDTKDNPKAELLKLIYPEFIGKEDNPDKKIFAIKLKTFINNCEYHPDIINQPPNDMIEYLIYSLFTIRMEHDSLEEIHIDIRENVIKMIDYVYNDLVSLFDAPNTITEPTMIRKIMILTFIINSFN